MTDSDNTLDFSGDPDTADDDMVDNTVTIVDDGYTVTEGAAGETSATLVDNTDSNTEVTITNDVDNPTIDNITVFTDDGTPIG